MTPIGTRKAIKTTKDRPINSITASPIDLGEDSRVNRVAKQYALVAEQLQSEKEL